MNEQEKKRKDKKKRQAERILIQAKKEKINRLVKCLTESCRPASEDPYTRTLNSMTAEERNRFLESEAQFCRDMAKIMNGEVGPEPFILPQIIER
jgi:hypothetical protein